MEFILPIDGCKATFWMTPVSDSKTFVMCSGVGRQNKGEGWEYCGFIYSGIVPFPVKEISPERNDYGNPGFTDLYVTRQSELEFSNEDKFCCLKPRRVGLSGLEPWQV
jgi:hypothetical protein